jgi:hypothetical protein
MQRTEATTYTLDVPDPVLPDEVYGILPLISICVQQP